MKAWIGLGCAGLVGCSGGRVTASTTAAGPSIPLEGEAAGYVGPTESCPLGGPRRIAGALITNMAHTCSALRSKRGGRSSGLFLSVAVEGMELPQPGTYRVEASARPCEPADDVVAELVDENGDRTTRHRATTGAITLTTVNRQHVAGVFDVHLEGGGQARGSFSAPVCDVDWSLYGQPRLREQLR